MDRSDGSAADPHPTATNLHTPSPVEIASFSIVNFTPPFQAPTGSDKIQIKVEEGLLEVRCSPARAVMLLGRGSKAVSALGESMVLATLSTDLVAKGGFGRVVVIGDDGRRAWSNPIWFDDPA